MHRQEYIATLYKIMVMLDMNEARYAEVYNRVVMSYHCT